MFQAEALNEHVHRQSFCDHYMLQPPWVWGWGEGAQGENTDRADRVRAGAVVPSSEAVPSLRTAWDRPQPPCASAT